MIRNLTSSKPIKVYRKEQYLGHYFLTSTLTISQNLLHFAPAFRALGLCEHIWPFSLRDIWATLLSPKWAETFVAQMAGDETSLPQQEQRPCGNGDREAIVVGAGLCDSEGERAYTAYAPYYNFFASRTNVFSCLEDVLDFVGCTTILVFVGCSRCLKLLSHFTQLPYLAVNLTTFLDLKFLVCQQLLMYC